MPELISYFQTNIGTILTGIIATVVGGYVLHKILFGTDNNKKEGVNITNTVNQSLNIPNTPKEGDAVRNQATSIIDHKTTKKILFIDNESLRDKIKGLKNAGWQNVTQIKDDTNIDSTDIRDANIIFVDYKGIGGKEKEQGLAVIAALRARYKKKKWLILFTAYDVPVTAFEKGADDYLAKNSGNYETEQKIIKGLSNLES